uniref:WSC domain-containing protein n=1 Tax=Macrostomum lignano TaxID=282301 RepID=A0A1I8HMR1_9PLAT
MSMEPTDQHELSSPVKQFCSYTSAHGLGRFSEQSSFIGRSLWLTFLLATYSGFGYHLYTLFDRYQQAPVLTNDNGVHSAVPVPGCPYVIYKQCMRWNDAARMLQRGSSNAEVLGGLLMKLNFSETESRCRLPPGPRREIIGCFPVTADTLNAFNITCYSGGLEAFEPCAQCCDKFNAPFAALLNRGDCLCGSSEAAATLADGSWTSCDRQCGNSKTEPCGSDRTAAVMIIRDVAATKEFDCAVSNNAGANVVYTGRTNWTESGRDCLPWSSVENVQMKMKLNQGVRFVEKLLRLKIQTPDRIGNTSDNFCRPVSIVIDLAETENGTFTRHPVLISNSPVCFADPSLLHTMSVPIFQTQFFEMAFERCTIPTCSAETSVRGVFTDSVGSHLLARQFSNDLSIGLADCTFAGQKCTKEHFVNIDHPQLGMCHQFLKQSFIANMSSTQLAGSQLSITYFTDSTDSKGKTVEGMPEMTSAFHNGMSLEISDLAFKVSGL